MLTVHMLIINNLRASWTTVYTAGLGISHIYEDCFPVASHMGCVLTHNDF